MVHAVRLTVDHEPVSSRAKPVAHVVVVPVPEPLIKETNLMEGCRLVRRVARADMVAERAGDIRVALVEIEPHRSDRRTRGRRGHVIALRRGDVRRREIVEQAIDPARRDHDVLVDLADDGILRRKKTGIDRRGRAASRSVDDRDRQRLRHLRHDRSRSVEAAVVDHDDLRKPAGQLSADRGQRLADGGGAVVHRHDEADSTGARAHATISPYIVSSSAQMVAPP